MLAGSFHLYRNYLVVYRILLLSLALCSLLLCYSCSTVSDTKGGGSIISTPTPTPDPPKDHPDDPPIPDDPTNPEFSVETIQPSSGSIGDEATIYGSGFLFSGADLTVFFANSPATILSKTNDSLRVTIPSHPENGLVTVKVQAGAETLQLIQSFEYLDSQDCSAIGPSINTFSPIAQYFDQGITLSGSNFGESPPIVQIGGVSADVQNHNSSSILVKVPFLDPTCANLDGCEVSITVENIDNHCTVEANSNLTFLVTDSDSDGAPDWMEPNCKATVGLSDSDQDGLPDGTECVISPECKANKKDTDNDGHDDLAEWTKFGTCTNNDWDEDGVNDNEDCDPNNGNRYQGAPDPPNDGIDTDCKIQKKSCDAEDEPLFNENHCIASQFPFDMGDNIWNKENKHNTYCVRAKIIPGNGPDEYKDAKIKIVVNRLKTQTFLDGASHFLAYEMFGELCGPTTWVDSPIFTNSIEIPSTSEAFENIPLGDYDVCSFFVDKYDPIFASPLPSSANNYLRVRKNGDKYRVQYQHTMLLRTTSAQILSSNFGNKIKRTCAMGD